MATLPFDQCQRSAASLPKSAAPPLGNLAFDRIAGPSSERDQRRVLIIASRFPPLASVGAIRIRKFVKYLGEFGWSPVVLTGPIPEVANATEDASRLVDSESLKEVPETVEIARTSGSADAWPESLSARLGNGIGSVTRFAGLSNDRWRDGLQWRFERLQNRLSFPDRGVWRTMSGLRLAKALHRRYRFDAIFSSGMPFSDHLIGLAVSRALRVPWIADFRDPWVEYIHWKQWTGRWGAKATLRAERAVIKNATRVVGVNDHITARFKIRYPKLEKRKFVTVENGFDPADFNVASPRQRNTRFTMHYAGSLYGARSPENLIRAFERFCERCDQGRDQAELIFVGRVGPFLDRIQSGSQENVRYAGMLNHLATCRAMRQADVNVVLLPKVAGSQNDSSAKVYECLGSGRPVFAAVPLNGSAAQILHDRPHVYLHDPEDINGMSASIEHLFDRWLHDDLPDRPVGVDL